MQPQKAYRSGFAGIVGRPNVGKSTLLNNLMRRKMAIISERPQTTRNKIRCVYTREDAQIVFVDTPGFHKPRNALGERLNQAVRETLAEVDTVAFMLDGSKAIGRGDAYIASQLSQLDTPKVVVLNKIDRMTRKEVAAQSAAAEELGAFRAVIPVSARTGENVHTVIESIVETLPEGPKYYPDDMLTDQPASFIVAELIREKALQLTREEVPHSVAVVVEEMEPREGRGLVDIDAVIYVERESQKGIVIGKGGKMLKEIGSRARGEIEPLLGDKVYLRLRVAVEKDWTKSPEMLKRLGY